MILQLVITNNDNCKINTSCPGQQLGLSLFDLHLVIECTEHDKDLATNVFKGGHSAA